MEKNKPQNLYIHGQERASLQALSSNIPLYQQLTKKYFPLNFISHRGRLVNSERMNKTFATKKITDIRQMLSKSLFYKDKKKGLIQKQKLKTFLCGNKLDNLPISPQTQQKQSARILNTVTSCKNVQKVLNCEATYEDNSLARYSQDMYFNSFQENQNYSTNKLLDQKFDNILELNLGEQDNVSLDIDSRFATKKAIKMNYDFDLEPFFPENRITLHERLLEEENQYLRQQLLFFAGLIQQERDKSQAYKQKLKLWNKEIQKLKQNLGKVQWQLERKEEDLFFLQNINRQLQTNIEEIDKQKKLLDNRLQEVLYEYDLNLAKLGYLEQEKQKQIEVIVQKCCRQKQCYLQQLSQKNREFLELNEFIQALKTKITFLQAINKESEKQNANLSTESDRVKQFDEEVDIQQQFAKTSSICLSLAEAQHIKNIIQQKEQLFQQQVQQLKATNLQNQAKYTKSIEQLQKKLKSKEDQLLLLHSSYSKEIQQMKLFNSQNCASIKKQLTYQQQKNASLLKQLRQALQKRNEEDCVFEDQQLDQLLQNCVDELERERNSNYLLHEQISEEKKINYILRTEVEKLKSLFNKEIYLIQQIQGRVFNN